VADPANGYFGLATIATAASEYAGVPGISSPSSVADVVAQQLATGATSVALVFSPPPAQGSSVPVVVERIAGPTGDLSNNDFTVSYAAPSLQSVAVLDADGATVLAGQSALVASDTARVPTRGGAFLKFTGTNMGVLPTFAIGRNPATSPIAPAPSGAAAPAGDDCSAPAGSYTCWRVAIPAGQGSGLQFSSEFGAETAGFTPSMQGLRGFYEGAAWGAWPGGYFAWLFAVGQGTTSS
jgi:hypothetical protein